MSTRHMAQKRPPAVSLLWMYLGKDAPARRKQLESLEYRNLSIIEVAPAEGWRRAIRILPRHTEICVFLVDDDKPIGNDFIDQMTRPLISGEGLRAVMHFWSGNAISIPKDMLDASKIEDGEPGIHSLLKLLVPVLDVAPKQPNGRIHIAFSSTEKLAPLNLESTGYLS